jgi:hypothetical protein
MARIRILQAISGSDFSWAPGDVVEVSDEQAEAWADGERAVHADHQDVADPVPAAVHQQPIVLADDGRPLDVLAATVEEIPPPAGADDSSAWARWTVTVRLPTTPAGPLFDPSEHSVKDVLAYLEGASTVEAERVLHAEETADAPRKGVLGEREAVLARARARDQAAVEHAAEDSRGGGRGRVIETR